MFTYQNIKNNSSRCLDFRLYNDEYFDVMLFKGHVSDTDYNIDENLIADFSTLDIKDGILYSTALWKDAVNEGVKLEDIGFTGIDNGLIYFQKDRISNMDFLKILTGSTYEIPSGDTRLFMTPITGNSQNFTYPMFYEHEESGNYIAFKGGFYQGFYKLFGFDYQVLPNGVDFEWNLSFRIRPRSDYEIETTNLNYLHPENSGIFFYMGTRAEDKFANMYKLDSGQTDSMKIQTIANDGYLDPSSCGESGETLTLENNVIHEKDYLLDLEKEEEKEKLCCEDVNKKNSCGCKSSKQDTWTISDIYNYKFDETSVNCCRVKGDEPCPDIPVCAPCSCSTYFVDDYFAEKEEPEPCDPNCCKPCSCSTYFVDDYFQDLPCYDGKKMIEEDYFGKDVDITNKDVDAMKDTFGHLINKKGYYEIESDNKFLMFDRTPEGFTTHDWIEGTKVTLTGRNDWGNINLFPIMNRTKTGYTTHNIDKYLEEHSKPFDIYKDTKNNAFALKITENGAIGYKYAILDCDADNEYHYSVKEEYSKDGLIKSDEWNNILIKIVILNPTITFNKNGEICPDINKGKRKMKLFFYLNGYLVFISKELPEFNFRELSDCMEKQEAVPFSISLGGGTQGLLESVMPDYYKAPEYIFPIEKDFCGTFMGDISSFKIYNGHVNFSTIKNYLLRK